uniref:Paralemmin 3 n=1 Tax=Balaenoptera musculus TaxID=9771 RepID=A0A8C0D3J0_BALMU
GPWETPLAAPPSPCRPMAESSLYRQRLEVIAEKRRLQEEIRAARRELEEEKLRVERLKRKSLRERWLMDGAAEEPERPQDPTSQDPHSPEDQAQARIRNLEGSSQHASTGAQHKPAGRPTWRRQGHRPLSQPTVEAGPAGQTDLNKRASIPAGPVGTYPESPSKSGDEAVGAPPAPRRIPGAAGPSSEANGPCPGSSPPPEQEPSQGGAASDGGVNEAKGGGMVKVVWEGLRATEDCTAGATGPELEAKVEEMVMEAIGDRQEAGRPELPSWVREDRGIVEVVWEGVGGTEGSDSEAVGEAGRGLEAAQTSSLRLQEGPGGAASGEGEGAPRGSPDGDGQGGFGGAEGSFIWVERVTLSEEWEELVVEGVEGPKALGREGKDESPPGAGGRGGEETWEVERRWAEESAGKRGGEGKAGAEPEGAEMSLVVERKGSEESLEKEVEGPLGAERERGEEPLGVEQKGGEEKLEATEEPLVTERKEGEESLMVERIGGEEALEGKEKGDEEPLKVERTGGEQPSEAETKGDEESQKAERMAGEEPLQTEKTQGVEEDLSPEEQRESGGGKECQAEEVSEEVAPLGAKEEPRPEEEGQQPQEKQEGFPEAEAVKPQTSDEGQDPSGDATPLLAETPAQEQPAECQPLLQVEEPRANPSAHTVPTYAPARQPDPSAPPEGEEASGPKQKTCQCCAVM